MQFKSQFNSFIINSIICCLPCAYVVQGRVYIGISGSPSLVLFFGGFSSHFSAAIVVLNSVLCFFRPPGFSVGVFLPYTILSVTCPQAKAIKSKKSTLCCFFLPSVDSLPESACFSSLERSLEGGKCESTMFNLRVQPGDFGA